MTTETLTSNTRKVVRKQALPTCLSTRWLIKTEVPEHLPEAKRAGGNAGNNKLIK
jgi:hypothetical protein